MTVDQNRLIRERKQGAKAEGLWEGLQEIFTEMEDDIRNGWKGSKADERERREEIYYFMRALEDLKQRLKVRIATGKFAAKQLERET